MRNLTRTAGPYLALAACAYLTRTVNRELSTRQRAIDAEQVRQRTMLAQLDEKVYELNNTVNGCQEYSNYLYSEMRKYLQIHKQWEETVRELHAKGASAEAMRVFAADVTATLADHKKTLIALTDRMVDGYEALSERMTDMQINHEAKIEDLSLSVQAMSSMLAD